MVDFSARPNVVTSRAQVLAWITMRGSKRGCPPSKVSIVFMVANKLLYAAWIVLFLLAPQVQGRKRIPGEMPTKIRIHSDELKTYWGTHEARLWPKPPLTGASRQRGAASATQQPSPTPLSSDLTLQSLDKAFAKVNGPDRRRISRRSPPPPAFDYLHEKPWNFTQCICYKPQGKRQGRRDMAELYAMVAFKPLDVKWLAAALDKKNRGRPYKGAFYQKVEVVPLVAGPFVLVHPYIVRAVRSHWLLRKKEGEWPTTGMIAIMLGMLLCERVTAYGYSYPGSSSAHYGHYYGRDVYDVACGHHAFEREWEVIDELGVRSPRESVRKREELNNRKAVGANGGLVVAGPVKRVASCKPMQKEKKSSAGAANRGALEHRKAASGSGKGPEASTPPNTFKIEVRPIQGSRS
eukprot:jgi/Mesvir1/24409/Mv11074-RA.1